MCRKGDRVILRRGGCRRALPATGLASGRHRRSPPRRRDEPVALMDSPGSDAITADRRPRRIWPDIREVLRRQAHIVELLLHHPAGAGRAAPYPCRPPCRAHAVIILDSQPPDSKVVTVEACAQQSFWSKLCTHGHFTTLHASVVGSLLAAHSSRFVAGDRQSVHE